MANVAVIYYSSTGTNQKIAEAVAEGAKAAGAEVRVRLIAENAPEAAIAGKVRAAGFPFATASVAAQAMAGWRCRPCFCRRWWSLTSPKLTGSRKRRQSCCITASTSSGISTPAREQPSRSASPATALQSTNLIDMDEEIPIVMDSLRGNV